MARISDLIKELSEEVTRISEAQENGDRQEDLAAILLESIHKTLVEIKSGADSDDFADLTVINFILAASKAKFDTKDIQAFVRSLKKDAE